MANTLPIAGITTGERVIDHFNNRRAEIDQFVDFILFQTGSLENVQRTAHEALVQIVDEKEKNRLLKNWHDRTSPLDDLKKHHQIIFEIILVKHVENYQTYLVHLLHELFCLFPKSLGNKQVDIEKLIELGSVDAVIADVAERSVDRMSFHELKKLFSEKFKIDLVDQESLSRISLAIDIRNIAVHNRSLINKRFVENNNWELSDIGHRANLTLNYVTEISSSLVQSVEKIDKQIKDKIRTTP